MQRQLLAGVALVAMAGSAFAADMPLKAVAPVAFMTGAERISAASSAAPGVRTTFRTRSRNRRDAARRSRRSDRRYQRLHRRYRGRVALPVSASSWSAGKATSPGARSTAPARRASSVRWAARRCSLDPLAINATPTGPQRRPAPRHRPQQLAALRQGRRRLGKRQTTPTTGAIVGIPAVQRHRQRHTGPVGRSAPASSGRSTTTGRSRRSTTTSTSAPRTSRSTARCSARSAGATFGIQDNNHINQFKAGLNYRFMPNFW